MIPQRRVFRVYATKLASDGSSGHQHMRDVYHQGRSQIASTSESHGGDLIIQRCKTMDIRAMGLATPWYRRGGTSVESLISCSHGGRALVVKGAEEVENAKSNSKYQDRAEGQRRRNFIRPMSMELDKSKDKAEYKTTDSRAMGLTIPWYRRGRTSVESSIPCSHGGRALVLKAAEPSNLAFSTTKRMGEVKYPSSLTYPVEELCTSSVFSFIRRIRENRQGLAQLSQPHTRSVIGELKQHGGSKFDYSTTMVESGWEPKGRVAAKAED
ncbi:hypothetical protein BHM03_00059043 [Ensete ventricosum]|nr:hypothetical protein BHM03_00059043 [Ensete ventricosum]